MARGQVSPEIAQKCMKTAFDLGINFFDTAEVYAGGQCEIDMGVAIRKFGWARSDLVISTKLFWGGKGRNERGLSRKHIIEGTDACLKRLQLDYVDLLYAHRPDPDTPMEEIVRAFNHVINQGKAFYWGTSEWSAQQITEAHAVAGRLNLIAPLITKVKKLANLAQQLDCSTSQLALAWCLKNPNISSVITGASKPSQIEENVKALAIVPLLTEEIMTSLEEILANKPALDYNFRSS
ncbi:hypothetical protein BGZ90_002703 [Linnemannia elongata]|nr:hypothetical protein BGZ90_002703 [Linnemannia elongata]